MQDPFAAAGFDLDRAIRSAAEGYGLKLKDAGLHALAAHARAVLGDEQDRHLTSIRDPKTFVERHIAEGLAGASVLEPDVEGTLLDMGSGNGYPGLVIAGSRPGLRPLLVEASRRKSDFLKAVIDQSPGIVGGQVLHAQVQRAADLHDVPPIRVLVTRAMGSWERVIPRLVSALRPDADVLVWAGGETEEILRRSSWKRLQFVGRRPLPGRDRAWIWHFRPVFA